MVRPTIYHYTSWTPHRDEYPGGSWEEILSYEGPLLTVQQVQGIIAGDFVRLPTVDPSALCIQCGQETTKLDDIVQQCKPCSLYPLFKRPIQPRRDLSDRRRRRS